MVNEEDVKYMKAYINKWFEEGFENAKVITKTKKRDWLDSPWKNFFKVSTL